METEVFERLNSDPKSIEWWGYMAAGMASMAADAVKSGDAAMAAWAGISAARFQTLALFRTHFEEAVFMGNSASRLIQLIKVWKTNQGNDSEGFWQETLKHHAYAFNQLFSVPVSFVEGTAYVGGMKIDKQDARYVDFMLSGGSSDDAILVEIKTPETKLLGRKYRKNAFPPSKELGGSIVQISDYAQSLREEIYSITKNTGININAFRPKLIIIIGNYKKELNDQRKIESFELFRSSLGQIEIVTFDEFFRKAEQLAKLFNIAYLAQ